MPGWGKLERSTFHEGVLAGRGVIIKRGSVTNTEEFSDRKAQ